MRLIFKNRGKGKTTDLYEAAAAAIQGVKYIFDVEKRNKNSLKPVIVVSTSAAKKYLENEIGPISIMFKNHHLKIEVLSVDEFLKWTRGKKLENYIFYFDNIDECSKMVSNLDINLNVGAITSGTER